MLSKLIADNINNIYIYIFEKIRHDISCESADDSHEMSSIIFLQIFKKIKMLFAAIVISALRVKVKMTVNSRLLMSVLYLPLPVRVKSVPTNRQDPARGLTTAGSLGDVPGVYDCKPSSD